jgi:tetratricopeptide (TPR) repeat protein
LINLRFLLASLLGFVLLGVAIYFLHAFQLHRQGAFMLARARQAKDEKRFESALRDYQSYLQMAPKDAEAQAESGLLMADLGMKWPASCFLESALRFVPQREDLRKRLVQLDIELGRYGDAREHLKVLLASTPTDDILWEQLGICQAGGGDDRAAVESFQKAIDLDPTHCETYASLAAVLRRLDRPQEADSWMEKLVAKNPESPQAHSLRAKYLRAQTTAQQEAALQEAEKAVALAPEDFDALLLAADLYTASGDYQKARGYANRAISAKPTQAGGYRLVSQIDARQGDVKKALASLRCGIEKATDARDLLWEKCAVLIGEAARPQPNPLLPGEGAANLTEAQETIAQLRRLPPDHAFEPLLIDYLQAQIEVARGRWSVAATAFADVVQQLERPDQKLGGKEVPGTPANELLKDAECRLALCYQQLGDSDAQLATYRKAVRLDPLCVPARMGVASTLASLGRVNEALEEYHQIGELKGAAAAADMDIARLLVLKNLRLPESQRDWKEAEAVFARIAQAAPDAVELAFLRAEALLAQGRYDETEKMLSAVRDKHPESIACWGALVKLAERQQQSQRAVELIEQAENKFGDRVWIRLARAGYLLTQQNKTHQARAPGIPGRPDVQGKRLIAELTKLGEDASNFSMADRVGLYRGLAVCLWEAECLEQAKAFAMKGCQADRTNLDLRLLLLELTCQIQDTSGIEKVLEEIRGIEGESPQWHYGQAMLQSLLANHSPGPRDGAHLFDRAFAHLWAAQRQRPGWSRPYLLQAHLYDQLGQTDSAIDNYVKAIGAGESDPAAIRRGFELLYSRQRYTEASEMLRHLDEREAVLFPELGRMASEVSMRLQNVDRAMAIARQVAEQSKNWADHLWLGQILASQGSRAEADNKAKEAQEFYREAEKALHRAVELSPETPEAWTGLIRFLALTDQKEQGQTMLAEAIKKLPAEKAPMALGPCYEILGHADEAAEQYQRILAQGGSDPLVLRQVAEFCLRTNKPLEAEKHLQRILGPEVSAKPQDIAWARRTMAGILRTRGGYANLLKAVELVRLNLAGGPAPEDLQVQALLLAAFPQRAKRKEAIDALEKVVSLQASDTADARFVLASLYLRENDWPQCSKHMRALLSVRGKEPRYVAVYVAMLLEQNEMQEAGLWLQRLDELAAGTPANLGLRVEMLVRRQQIDLAIQTLRETQQGAASQERGTESKDKRILQTISILSSVAQRAGQRGDKTAKERLLAEMDNLLKDYVTRHPEDQLLMASMRILQGRVDEALTLAEKLWPNADARLLAVELAQWASSAKLAPEQVMRLDRLLLAVTQKQGRPLAILQILGDLRMRYRPQNALEVYREMLQRDARSPSVLNNMALLLVLEKREVQESLKQIDEAIAMAGPVSAFLDTRAIALMGCGRPQEALADLEEAIRDDPRPDYYFHQALAYRQLGQKKAANDAFLEAGSRGLKPEDLVGLDRAKYEELTRNLSQ